MKLKNCPADRLLLWRTYKKRNEQSWQPDKVTPLKTVKWRKHRCKKRTKLRKVSHFTVDLQRRCRELLMWKMTKESQFTLAGGIWEMSTRSPGNWAAWHLPYYTPLIIYTIYYRPCFFSKREHSRRLHAVFIYFEIYKTCMCCLDKINDSK